MNAKSLAMMAVAAAFTAPVSAHDEDGKSPKQALGSVSFANSCSKAVQKELNRGVALLHSFWFSEGEAAFRSVLAEDPSCSIAAWGAASILMNNAIAGQGASPGGAEQAR